MLNRRHLRIKVLHAFYAYRTDPQQGLVTGERNLRRSIEGIYDLYLYELRALWEIFQYAEHLLEVKRKKRLPSYEDLHPSRRFVENQVYRWMQAQVKLQEYWDDRHIRFGDDREILHKVFRDFQADESYQEYLQMEHNTVSADKKLLRYLYGQYLSENESLHQLYEERYMHWADDLDAAQMMVSKTLKKISGNEEAKALQPLFKDQEDLTFALKLFRTAVNENELFEQEIQEKTQNWDAERIAVIDILLMKLALAELTTFEQIPVKVTLNEFIELSKQYSTPKSGHFINGILDKIKDSLQEKGQIRKVGRGLL
jgi:N utilization substance protein B